MLQVSCGGSLCDIVPRMSDKSSRGRVVTIGRLQHEGLHRSLLRVTAAVTLDGAVMLRSDGLRLTMSTPVAKSDDTACWSAMMSPTDSRRAVQLLLPLVS